MNVICQFKLTGARKAVYAARSSLADENLDFLTVSFTAQLICTVRFDLDDIQAVRWCIDASVSGWVDGPKDSNAVCLIRPSGIGPPKRGPKLRDPALRGPDKL